MKNIIRQIEENQVFNVVCRIHDINDIEEGDLVERIENYKYYNHIADFDLTKLKLNNYSIDMDKVEDIVFEIKEKGLSTMPKIVIDHKFDIIDGVHRAMALLSLGVNNIDILVGTNKKEEMVFSKTLVDENLKIYKISNQFGSISVMENARYSPAENSIFEFIVEDRYRGLGVGTELLKEAMRQYKELGAQVSSLASIKVFLECGFEPEGLFNKNKFSLDVTSYDFKVFNKDNTLLNEQAALYRADLLLFNQKMENAVMLFNNNDCSLYFADKRVPVVELKNKEQRKIKI